MVELLRKRDDQLSRLRHSIRTMNQRERRQKAAQEEARAQAEAAAQSAAADRSLQTTLKFEPNNANCKKLRWWSSRNYLAIAIRRNFSNISQEAFGATVLSDVSRHTVSRAESHAGTLLAARARLFYRLMRGQLPALSVESQEEGGWSMFLHTLRGDATNSSVWQRRKLQTLEVASCYVRDPAAMAEEEAPLPGAWWSEMMAESRQVADLQVVADASGAGTVAMITKQMASIGCPMWDELLERHANGLVAPRELHLWVSVSDCGPDQVLAQKILATKLAPVRAGLFLGSKCYQHQGQLIVGPFVSQPARMS